MLPEDPRNIFNGGPLTFFFPSKQQVERGLGIFRDVGFYCFFLVFLDVSYGSIILLKWFWNNVKVTN